MDQVAEFGVLLAVSVAAHMAVAYGLAPRAATKRIERWFGEERGQSMISEAASRDVGPVLEKVIERAQAQAPEVPDVGAEVGSWLKGAEGQEWARQLGDHAGRAAAQALEARFGSAQGADARSALSAAEKLSINLDLGDPYANAAWALIPAQARARIVRQLYRGIVPQITGQQLALEPSQERLP
jgi:hypothetical protein